MANKKKLTLPMRHALLVALSHEGDLIPFLVSKRTTDSLVDRGLLKLSFCGYGYSRYWSLTDAGYATARILLSIQRVNDL